MSNRKKPVFGRWTTTLNCQCGHVSVIDMHAFRWLRSFDQEFITPKCDCGRELLTLSCVIPDTIWHFGANRELKGTPN